MALKRESSGAVVKPIRIRLVSEKGSAEPKPPKSFIDLLSCIVGRAVLINKMWVS